MLLLAMTKWSMTFAVAAVRKDGVAAVCEVVAVSFLEGACSL